MDEKSSSKFGFDPSKWSTSAFAAARDVYLWEPSEIQRQDEIEEGDLFVQARANLVEFAAQANIPYCEYDRYKKLIDRERSAGAFRGHDHKYSVEWFKSDFKSHCALSAQMSLFGEQAP